MILEVPNADYKSTTHNSVRGALNVRVYIGLLEKQQQEQFGTLPEDEYMKSSTYGSHAADYTYYQIKLLYFT
jgi:hypothetical protein